MRTKVSEEELNAIKYAMDNEKIARVFKRYQALYLFLFGKTCRDIAKTIGITKTTVCNLHKIYQNEGLAGIPDKSIPGRPTRLTLEERNALKEVILSNLPSDVGFATDFNWTAGLIAKYIKREYGYDYSIRGITGMLDRMGLSYTRPTYVLANADKEKQGAFIQDFELI
jgi:putative transposase